MRLNEQPTRRRLLAYGDIIIYTYPGQSVPHHVVIYLGGDRILEHRRPARTLRYDTLAEFTGQITAVPRTTEA